MFISLLNTEEQIHFLINALSNYLTINLRPLQEKEFAQLIQVICPIKVKVMMLCSFGNIECFELSTISSTEQSIPSFGKIFSGEGQEHWVEHQNEYFLYLTMQRKTKLILRRNWRIVIVFIWFTSFRIHRF